jgi:hypothetical protein
MLTDRIIAAFTFRREVYKEVEKDTKFTQTAWLLVIVVAFLAQLGSRTSDSLVGWLIGAVLGTIFAIVGFAVGAFIINWVGRTVFNADVTFEELVRTLGLAYVWNVVGVIGVLGVLSDALACLLAPITFIAWIAGLVSWFVAAKEALDLEWVQTIVTVVVGWIVVFVIVFIGGLIVAALGFAAAAIGGAV